jgi:hypothetical protein
MSLLRLIQIHTSETNFNSLISYYDITNKNTKFPTNHFVWIQIQITLS